jgi:hypothetical protein
VIEAAADRISRFRRKGVLLDTNLLLVYLVGLIDRNLVPSFKRTEGYRTEDFDLLVTLISPVEKLITTPHVATEVHSLAGHLDGNAKYRFRDLFESIIPNVKESHRPAKQLCTGSAYKTFGLTDAAIHKIGQRRLVLTDDFPLSAYIQNTGGNVLNFTNLRLLI